MSIGRLRLTGGLGLALAAAGCASLLGVDGFRNQAEGGAAGSGAGGSTGGTGGWGGDAGSAGDAGGVGGATGGSGGSGAALRVFVTFEDYGGNLQGIDGADARCVEAAAQGVLTHDTDDWQAWLSAGNGGESLQDRFAADGRWALLNGDLAFENRFRLFDGQGPTHPIAINQHGDPMGSGGGATAAVWTGTTAAGQPELPNHCEQWTHGGDDHRGSQGHCGTGDGGWTEHESNWCWHRAHLYCFEVPPGTGGGGGAPPP